MPFTLTDNPQLYELEMSLSNILMTRLFCSNKRMVIFSQTDSRTFTRLDISPSGCLPDCIFPLPEISELIKID